MTVDRPLLAAWVVEHALGDAIPKADQPDLRCLLEAKSGPAEDVTCELCSEPSPACADAAVAEYGS